MLSIRRVGVQKTYPKMAVAGLDPSFAAQSAGEAFCTLAEQEEEEKKDQPGETEGEE